MFHFSDTNFLNSVGGRISFPVGSSVVRSVQHDLVRTNFIGLCTDWSWSGSGECVGSGGGVG